MRQTTNFHKAELLLPNAKLHTYRRTVYTTSVFRKSAISGSDPWPNPTHKNTNSRPTTNPTQPNPWVNPTHGQLWSMDSKGICFANAMRILGLHCLCLLFTDSTVIGATHVVLLSHPTVYLLWYVLCVVTVILSANKWWYWWYSTNRSGVRLIMKQRSLLTGESSETMLSIISICSSIWLAVRSI